MRACLTKTGLPSIDPEADLRGLPKKAGRVIRVTNFSLFEGNARV
jgi:hypothetical protein